MLYRFVALSLCVVGVFECRFPFHAGAEPPESLGDSTSISFVVGSRYDTPDQMMRHIRSLERPVFDQARLEDVAYRNQFRASFMAYLKERSLLSKAFYHTYPEHEQAPTMLLHSWLDAMSVQDSDSLLAEIESFVGRRDTIGANALYAKARFMMDVQQVPFANLLPVVQRWTTEFPQDDRPPAFLKSLADGLADSKDRCELYRRIASEYPKSKECKCVAGKIRRLESIGKKIELKFADHITQKPIDLQELKGKVIVIDFWATWCGPCVSQMPYMVDVYDKYKNRNVEFIGVSLDRSIESGGEAALTRFVMDRRVPWPQYYQGNGWDSEWSRSWGIDSLPARFFIDQQGTFCFDDPKEPLESTLERLLNVP